MATNRRDVLKQAVALSVYGTPTWVVGTATAASLGSTPIPDPTPEAAKPTHKPKPVHRLPSTPTPPPTTPTTPTPPGAQTITGFTVTPSSITAGQVVVVVWQTANATAIQLNGATVSAAGSQSFSPGVSTTYTLKVDGSSPSLTQTLGVTVTAAPTAPPPAAAAAGAPTILWDGDSGCSGEWFNLGANLPWQNLGGDWTDAGGVAQGATAYARITATGGGVMSANVTNLVKRWYSIANTGVFVKSLTNPATIATRMNATPANFPVVTLTLDDGSTMTCTCTGSGVADRSSFSGQKGPALSVQPNAHMCLQFALPSLGSRNITSATLKLTAIQVFGGSFAADILELRPPKIFSGGTPVLGLAQNYPLDVGITNDPNVRFKCNFTEPNWNQQIFGGYVAPDSTVAVDATLGTPAINVKYHVGEFGPFTTDHTFSPVPIDQQGPSDCPSELYFRYYLKLKTGYQCSDQGKKLPGLAGRYGWWNSTGYYQPVDGNGGSPTKGTKIPYAGSPQGFYYSGWSMRHQAGPGCTDANPYQGDVSVFTYAYWAEMPGYYGTSWRWGNPQVGYVNFSPDQWYCIEQYVKMNTVIGPFDSLGNGTGVRDGVLRAWIDGVLVVDKSDIVFRKHPGIKIDEVWLDHYHGGTTPAEKEHPFAMANVVVANAYIGPMKKTSGTSSTPVVPSGSWPFTLPAPGTRGILSSNTLASVGASDSLQVLDLDKVLGAWGSAAQSVVKDGNGKVTDVLYWIWGGGHNDAGNDGVYAWRASTGKFEVMLPPTRWDTHGVVDALHGEDIPGRPASNHAYQNIYGTDSDEPGGAGLVKLRGSAVGKFSNSDGQTHRFNAAAKTWARFSSNFTDPQGAPYVSAFIKDASRRRFVRYPSDNYPRYGVLDYSQNAPAWQNLAQRGTRSVNWSDVYTATGLHDPVRDLYIVGMYTGNGQLCAVPGADPAAPFVALNQTGSLPPGIVGTGLQYRPVADEFLLLDTSTVPPTRVFVLKPPASNPLTSPWTWTTRTFAGPASRFANAGGVEWYNRWQYVAAFDALIVCPSSSAPMECWKL